MKDIIKEIANKTLETERDVKNILDLFINILKRKLENGEKVTIYEFGTFTMKTYEPCTRYLNGQKIKIPQRRKIKFKMSYWYQRKINQTNPNLKQNAKPQTDKKRS